ncbi:MAG TPA: radical SAM family heme chaperone HemW [Thermomicrobiaceae bacterium]|nr:radical SAM family heme chaperone HemW [Thermomicrobiaceae bacterium]
MIPPAPAAPDAPFGIYVHIPFCTRICPYCDFNTYAHQEGLIPAYVDALLQEITLTGAALGPIAAETIFFGGGTPSLLEPDDIARVVAALRAHFRLPDDAEVSLEANPEGLEPARLRGLRRAGVNRLSIGVQTLAARGLKVLGRAHKPDVPARALAAARAAGFDNISLDFIFGWPGQTLDDWRSDLDAMLAWQPEHLSLYSLIVEPGTPYQKAVRRGKLILPDDDATADMYELAIDRLAAAGWEHYEVSNWAREPGLESRHNAIYWRNGQYLGLGAGAHAHLGTRRCSNLRPTAEYIAACRAGRLPLDFSESLDEATAIGETLMLGLRLVRDGVADAAFRARHGRSLEATFGPQISELGALGLLDWDGARLRLTRRGLLLANDVAARFLPEPAPIAG